MVVEGEEAPLWIDVMTCYGRQYFVVVGGSIFEQVQFLNLNAYNLEPVWW